MYALNKFQQNNKGEFMTINEDTVKSKWLEIKGEVQKTWGKISSDELEKIKGDIKAIAGLVQQKYGEDKEKFEKKFSEISNKLQASKNTKINHPKENLRS